MEYKLTWRTELRQIFFWMSETKRDELIPEVVLDESRRGNESTGQNAGIPAEEGPGSGRARQRAQGVEAQQEVQQHCDGNGVEMWGDPANERRRRSATPNLPQDHAGEEQDRTLLGEERQQEEERRRQNGMDR